ncbi:hypothetical protein DTO271G3_4435 [Paecilomyces variotii]|nr:hypothetical protein DTO271G3_4435 [Paecilomyces variotii]
MARTKENEAEWQKHRDELEFLWLEQRWTAERIRDYMSQKHGFHQNKYQYSRQFKQWGFKKNTSDERWKFIAHRREKRKRDGKDPGPVSLDGRLVPESKVRKETSRHVTLTSQYMGIEGSDPKTPEGVIVGTPPSGITGAVSLSNDSSDVFAMDWCQDLSIDIPNLDASTLFQPAIGDSHAFQFELPELSSSVHCYPGVEVPAAPSFDLGHVTLEHCFPELASAVTPTSVDGNSHIQHISSSMSNEIAEEARFTLLQNLRRLWFDHDNNFISVLEPITIGGVNSDLKKRAQAIFQSSSPENLSHYLNLCIYLSSNNMMHLRASEKLVSLIAKSRSQPRLRALLVSTTTTTEIFMSNLLVGAAAVGDVEICRTLIEAGADLDAPSGLGMRTTALHRALLFGKMECVRMLLKAGADPNLIMDGETPLHIACSTRSSLDAVRLLLQFGAHVNPAQNSARLTPLQLAVQAGEPDLVQLLLDSKANPNSFTTSSEGSALQIACSDSRNAKIVELLIAAGADIDSRPGYQRDKRNPDYLGDSDTESESDDDLGESLFSNSVLVPPSFKPAILIAAENDNWEVVQLLLEEGAAVNASLGKCPVRFLEKGIDEISYMGGHPVFTPLQAAIRAENITMTRMLLSAGAHIDARRKGKYGHTALQICAMIGNERLIEILLRKKADINAPAGVFHGRTALQAAATNSDPKVLSILLREGANVNALPAERQGKTALQIAAAAGNTEGVRILLDANAAVNVDPALTEGVTALGEAIKISDSAIRHEIVNLLLRAGAYTENPQNRKQYAPLHIAVRESNWEITRQLLEKGASPNVGFCALTQCTPLQQASSQQSGERLVQLLINYGADVNGKPHPYGGRTALQAATECGHKSVVKTLLTFGAKIKAERASIDGISAVEAAASNCDQEIIQLFLDKEPDIISSDPIAKSRVIMLALASWNCDVPFLELLLKAGAAVEPIPPSTSEPSVLQTAIRTHNYRVVQLLLSAGAIVNHRWETDYPFSVTALQGAVHKQNIDVVQLLVENDADINAPAAKNGGKTALQTAVSQNNSAMTKLLVHHGANVNGLPSPLRGRTALQQAASSGFVQLTEYLLARGADVNAPAAHFGGVTALQGAALQGNIRIVMMLLQAGADINGAPAIEQGRNAIEGAAENGRLDTLHLLLNYHPNTEEFEIKKKRAAKLALANGHLAIGRFLLAYRRRG